MTTQQPQDTITPDEIGAEWGIKLGAALLEKVALQKQAERLTVIANEYANRIGELEIEVVKAAKLAEQNEARLQAHIQELETRIAEFTTQEYDFVDHIQALELELDAMKNPHPMSDASAKIAAEGDAIIAGAKEKAAPD